MKIRYLSIAEWELDETFRWYEQQVAGLGYEFLDEVDRILHRIKQYPKSCPEIILGFRQARITRFPYGLIYHMDGDIIVIVSVAHMHREPYFWIERMS